MTTAVASPSRAALRNGPPSPARTTLDGLLHRTSLACTVQRPSGQVVRYGAEPRFHVTVHSDRFLRRDLDEITLGAAYMAGDFDIEGDMLHAMEVRAALPDRIPLATQLGFWLSVLLRGRLARNRAAVDFHYTLGDDFYLSYIDRRYRFYSHGLFHRDDESLEEASEHKLERMVATLGLEPGMRLLDIGGGWGGVAQYCGQRGVHVTELTIARDSHDYIARLIEEQDLPAQVRFEDFLVHRPTEPYDAIVIYGVIEHIPNYRRFFERVWECLRPGGRLYVDASATRRKYSLSGYSRRFIWPGTHSPLALQEFVQELLLHGMDLLELVNESRDYHLTMWHWAQRFDDERDLIIARWGERVYRAFRLYLWGGCWGFAADRMQAYSLVARRRAHPGPRPGPGARLLDFVRSSL